MENKEVGSLFTDFHRELIKAKITDAIENIDFEEIVKEFVEVEFEYASNNCNVANEIGSHIVEVIRHHLTKSGLLGKEE